MTTFESVEAYKIADIILAVRVEEICRRASTRFAMTDSLEKLEAGLNGSLLVCDLLAVKSELEILKKTASRKNSKIFGYYPHIYRETAILAHSIGIDYVIPRSAMQKKLSLLLL